MLHKFASAAVILALVVGVSLAQQQKNAQKGAQGTPTRAKRATYDVVCLVVTGEGCSTIGDHRFDWSPHDVFTIPHWTWAHHEAKGADADLFMVTDKSALERLDLVREEFQ